MNMFCKVGERLKNNAILNRIYYYNLLYSLFYF